MKTFHIASAVSTLAGLTAAYPNLANQMGKGVKMMDIKPRQDPVDHSWIPRQPDGVRAPCPGTNTLANHGYINRNGLGISAEDYMRGFSEAFNMDQSVTQAGATNAINLCSQITGTTCQTFDLWMLDTPHVIEHDGSLTRSDRGEKWNQDNNNYDFNTTRFGQTLSAWGGETHIDLSLANSARLLRNSIQRDQDDAPGWWQENDGGALTEHGFFLSTMNDQTVSPGQDAANPQARLDWIAHWWQFEELPTMSGWVRPTQVINNDYVQALGANVAAAPTRAPAPGSFPQEADPPAVHGKRAVAISSILAQPSGSASLASAASQASVTAGPRPTIVNAYTTVLEPEQLGAQIAAVESYINNFDSALNSLLDLPPS